MHNQNFQLSSCAINITSFKKYYDCTYCYFLDLQTLNLSLNYDVLIIPHEYYP